MIVKNVKLMEGSLPEEARDEVYDIVYDHNLYNSHKKHGIVNQGEIRLHPNERLEEGDVVNIEYDESSDFAVVTKLPKGTKPEKYMFFKSLEWKIPTSIETEETYELLDNSHFSKEICTTCKSYRYGIKGLLFILGKDDSVSITVKDKDSNTVSYVYAVLENGEPIVDISNSALMNLLKKAAASL